MKVILSTGLILFLAVLAKGQDAAPVRSAVVSGLQYEEQEKLLTVQFSDGREVTHSGVPVKLYEEFKAIHTKGGFYKGRIATAYPVVRESGSPEESTVPAAAESVAHEQPGEAPAPAAAGEERADLGKALDDLARSVRQAQDSVLRAQNLSSGVLEPELVDTLGQALRGLQQMQVDVDSIVEAFGGGATGEAMEKSLREDVQPTLRKVEGALAAAIPKSGGDETRSATRNAVQDAARDVKVVDRDVNTALAAALDLKRSGG